MEKPKNKFTLKIIISYLLLLILAGIAAFYIYSEIGRYLTKDLIGENDSKLLKTGSLLTQLYEAEGLSKHALQSKKRRDFDSYVTKIDSIYEDIKQLKTATKNEYQKNLLDSLKILLQKKVDNNSVLRKLKTQDQTSAAIDQALNKFDKLEKSLGVITPEGISPNFKDLSPKAQDVIKKLAQYLNENIPPEESDGQNAVKADSVLQASKALLKEVQKENTINVNSLAAREIAINKTDMELSQQLRSILSSFEQEIIMNTIDENIKREAALKRSIRLAIIAALLGFLVVGIFIFILNRDFWKANLFRKKLEKEKKYSETLLKSREQLIGTVSHDLRTPLNAITGYTDLLENSKITPKQAQHLSHIKSATDYVNNLVNDLLDFSQLEAGKMVPEKTSFSLFDLLHETVKDFETTQNNGKVTTKTYIDDALKKPMINDPLRIRQIVSNLLGNAYKFTKEGSVILKASLVSKGPHTTKVKITVSDTGIGISPEEQQLIFNEFTQAKDQDIKRYGGYGLGLTISKKLTELLGGTITLESEVAQGSSFTLELPMLFSSETILQKKKPALNLPNKPLKILVIDDDPAFLHMLGEMMKTANIDTILYSDFEKIRKDTPLKYDIVLTDIEMPNASGFDVVKSLLNLDYGHFLQQPIIAMTGRRDFPKDHFVSLGFAGVIRKPFSKREILDLIFSFFKEYNVQSESIREGSLLGEDETTLYNLSQIKLFLGDDEQAINELLHTFYTDTKENKEHLEKSVQTKNIKELNRVAHKMLPMFRQMAIESCVPILVEFELATLENTSWSQIKSDFLILRKKLEKLLSAIRERII
ncbi:hybrid sensor histidine kinase/response regulator [Maribacter thermophilus]|uniref:hybrid sensor histidine kinase/response regulator n=1 Tax=Maribacter thermophilus TaxID=1197874 RepID=UPI00069C8114|nr:ATP-binding protein [Maribacter thermophilus]